MYFEEDKKTYLEILGVSWDYVKHQERPLGHKGTCAYLVGD